MKRLMSPEGERSYPDLAAFFADFRAMQTLRPFTCTFSTCPRRSEGFSSIEERDEHERFHRPRIMCSETSCQFHKNIGFSNKAQLNRHMRKYHREGAPSIPAFPRPRLNRSTTPEEDPALSNSLDHQALSDFVSQQMHNDLEDHTDLTGSEEPPSLDSLARQQAEIQKVASRMLGSLTDEKKTQLRAAILRSMTEEQRKMASTARKDPLIAFIFAKAREEVKGSGKPAQSADHQELPHSSSAFSEPNLYGHADPQSVQSILSPPRQTGIRRPNASALPTFELPPPPLADLQTKFQSANSTNPKTLQQMLDTRSYFGAEPGPESVPSSAVSPSPPELASGRPFERSRQYGSFASLPSLPSNAPPGPGFALPLGHGGAYPSQGEIMPGHPSHPHASHDSVGMPPVEYGFQPSSADGQQHWEQVGDLSSPSASMNRARDSMQSQYYRSSPTVPSTADFAPFPNNAPSAAAPQMQHPEGSFRYPINQAQAQAWNQSQMARSMSYGHLQEVGSQGYIPSGVVYPPQPLHEGQPTGTVSYGSSNATQAPTLTPHPATMGNPMMPYTRANTGTYTCTYHGCTQRFESQPALQRHKRDYHRSQAHNNRDSGADSVATSVSPSSPGARSTESPAPSDGDDSGMTSAALLARNSHNC